MRVRSFHRSGFFGLWWLFSFRHKQRYCIESGNGTMTQKPIIDINKESLNTAFQSLKARMYVKESFLPQEVGYLGSLEIETHSWWSHSPYWFFIQALCIWDTENGQHGICIKGNTSTGKTVQLGLAQLIYLGSVRKFRALSIVSYVSHVMPW